MSKSLFTIVLTLFVLSIAAEDLVYLEHSETLSFDEQAYPGAQLLVGNVIFRHDSALMYCDTAYFYESQNTLHAYGHVRMVQGDSVKGYARKMFYNGETKFARFIGNVRLYRNADTLLTDTLNYNRAAGYAYYTCGGTLKDSLNVMTSHIGNYNTQTSQARFTGEVHLVNPKFALETELLDYNTKTKIADLVAPTDILYEEETTIYTSRGTYNTDTEESVLLNRSVVHNQNGIRMTGDTIYYDKKVGYGRIHGAMEMIDSTNYTTLYGDYGEMKEEHNRGYATGKALMEEWGDSLHHAYTHADTLFTEDVPTNDTAFRRIRAYYGVRMYRYDFQAVCDSLVYTTEDSVITLYQEPRCWNENNQMSADTIRVYIVNDAVDHIHGKGSALAVRESSSDYYDQMAGKEIFAYIVDGEMRQLDVNGNAETIYYPQEEQADSTAAPEYLGMNRTICSHVRFFLENEEIDHVLFTSETTGVMYPLDQIPPGEDRLSGYFWAEQERPTSPMDVLNPTRRLERPSTATKSAADVIEEDSEAVRTAKENRKAKIKERNKAH